MKRICVVILLAAMVACSHPSRQAQSCSVDMLVTDTISVLQPDNTDTMATTQPIDSSCTDRECFESGDEAYNEGYCVGEQQGYSDAIHHLDYGYSYDDDPEYDGFIESYLQGCEEGYDYGYRDGQDWNRAND